MTGGIIVGRLILRANSVRIGQKVLAECLEAFAELADSNMPRDFDGSPSDAVFPPEVVAAIHQDIADRIAALELLRATLTELERQRPVRLSVKTGDKQ